MICESTFLAGVKGDFAYLVSRVVRRTTLHTDRPSEMKGSRCV